ncbi:MAG: hypothetical protein R6U91_08165 [Bacillota bacterium]
MQLRAGLALCVMLDLVVGRIKEKKPDKIRSLVAQTKYRFLKSLGQGPLGGVWPKSSIIHQFAEISGLNSQAANIILNRSVFCRINLLEKLAFCIKDKCNKNGFHSYNYSTSKLFKYTGL